MTKPSVDRIIRDSRDGCLALSQGEANVLVDEIIRLRKIEAAARDLIDNSPVGDNDKPYCSDVTGREFDALYLSLQPQN